MPVNAPDDTLRMTIPEPPVPPIDAISPEPPPPPPVFTAPAVAAGPGALVAPRAHPRPARQMPSCGEAAHVDADLRDQHLCGEATDSGDRVEELHHVLFLVRLAPGHDLGVEPLIGASGGFQVTDIEPVADIALDPAVQAAYLGEEHA